MCEFATAILHVFMREGIADTGGKMKKSLDPGDLAECHVEDCDLSHNNPV